MLTSVIAKAQEKGLQESARLGSAIVRAKTARLTDRGRRGFVFVSPPLNNSGAPLILMQMVAEFATRYGSESVRLLAPRGVAGLVEEGALCGVTVERAAEVLSPTLVRLQLALRKDDFVLLNTAAVSRNYLEAVLRLLQTGSLSHAYWYIHEDVRQLSVVAPFLLEAETRSAIGQLVTQRRLTILVPSKGVKSDYDSLFNTFRTKVLPFKSEVGHAVGELPADHYSSLRFLMSGNPTDGRKGHMVALAAFHEFMKAHYESDPTAFRPFTLTLLGMNDDYISEQIRSIGATILGDRLNALPGVPHEKALEITRACNAVVCCSFHETGPLYVIEGMRYGHIVLRNDAGGMEEQLDNGVNGFSIDSKDVRQFARVLARVLNRLTTSDAQLQTMGRSSQRRVADLLIPSYVEALEGGA